MSKDQEHRHKEQEARQERMEKKREALKAQLDTTKPPAFDQADDTAAVACGGDPRSTRRPKGLRCKRQRCCRLMTMSNSRSNHELLAFCECACSSAFCPAGGARAHNMVMMSSLSRTPDQACVEGR